MTPDALIPAPDAQTPRRCRCGRPVPVGRLVEGWGSGCAAKHGLTPPPKPRIPAPRTPSQPDAPTLFDPAPAPEPVEEEPDDYHDD